MVAENYACAYREVIEILKYTNQDDVNKIPSEKLLLWLDNMKEDYNFEIDEEKPLSEQNISKEAKAILANIFKEYWATDYQKQRIEEKEKYDMEKLEKEKYEKLEQIYNTQIPYISLANSKYNVLYNSNLVGDVSPNWYNVFYNIEGWYK